MSFVMYGEFLCVTREEDEDTRQWGFLPDQTIWVTNNLGDADVDLMLKIECRDVLHEIDWRMPARDTNLSIQRSRHGWAYVSAKGPFKLDALHFEYCALRLPGGDRTLAVPMYESRQAVLMFPKPSERALVQASDLAIKSPVEPIDFLTIYPCWPAERTVSDGIEWRSDTQDAETERLVSADSREPVVQPSTGELRRKLELAAKILFCQGVVLREVTSFPVGEAWWGVTASISPAELTALGKLSANEVPIAWFGIAIYTQQSCEDVLRERTDPEHLVEEWWDRLDLDVQDEPPPGENSTNIYYQGDNDISASWVGSAIASACRSCGLHVDWSGNPGRAVKVRL